MSKFDEYLEERKSSKLKTINKRNAELEALNFGSKVEETDFKTIRKILKVFMSTEVIEDKT